MNLKDLIADLNGRIAVLMNGVTDVEDIENDWNRELVNDMMVTIETLTLIYGVEHGLT